MGIGEQIETIVNSMTGNNNPPQIVTIRKGYANNTADIITKNGILKNVKCSGQATAGDNALLTYDNGDMQTPFVLLFNGNGGGGDLSDYVRKDEFLDLFDVDFNYNWGNPLLNDDSITIDLFLKEKNNGDGE